MLISFGFDDNSHSGMVMDSGNAMKWILNFLRDKKNQAGTGNAATFDNSPMRATFLSNTYTFASNNIGDYPTPLKWMHNKAFNEGYEIGNHAHSHAHGAAFSKSQWTTEIKTCTDWLTKPAPKLEDSVNITMNTAEGAGIPAGEQIGFRTPYLEYNAATFDALMELGFKYDCSIEDGYQDSHTGKNYLWPYTLDNGSPGHDKLVEMGSKNFKLNKYPGLWELPAYPFLVPPDDLCSKYGITTGFRLRLHNLKPEFDVTTGKMTGLDYNMWYDFRMTKEEFLAVLKYTLDLRLEGNRAPFLIGCHSQYYSTQCSPAVNSDPKQRQWAIEEFIKYALLIKDVRFVRFRDVLAWCKNPVALLGAGIRDFPHTASDFSFVVNSENRKLSITLNAPSLHRNLTIRIVTFQGKSVFQKSAAQAKTTYEYALPQSIPAGMYIISVVNAAEYNRKICIR